MSEGMYFGSYEWMQRIREHLGAPGPHVHFDLSSGATPFAAGSAGTHEHPEQDDFEAKVRGYRVFDPEEPLFHDEAGLIQARRLIIHMPVVPEVAKYVENDDRPILNVETEEVEVFEITDLPEHGSCTCWNCKPGEPADVGIDIFRPRP